MPARIVLAAIVLAAALPALAEDPPLPPLTPAGEYLVMTRDDATSTSICIGNPVTPMCAVETVMACEIRGDDELCRIGMGLEKKPNLAVGTNYPEIYRIVRREVLNDRRFPWHPTRDLAWRPGEIGMESGDLRIDIVSKFCRGAIEPAACENAIEVSPRVAYIVRRQGNRWAVIDWRPPYRPSYLGPSGFEP